jgi:3D-(3,5/4)-trihydroxycyclohexane-1,2-dione acylhydrolase (decyclizing)
MMPAIAEVDTAGGRSAHGTIRLTMAQALVRFLAAQRSERDGVVRPLFAGVFGIFGHGNVAGIGQALQQYSELLPFIPTRNEQAQVHAAAAYARMKDRLQLMACTSSIGPGATNMVTGAAPATINRLPVLLLPGDIFATRQVNPVLQQLEYPGAGDISVNDCFRPVSRYWDRIERPEQLLSAAPEAMRVLTHPAETGAVTLALPQDVQAEAYDYPLAFFRERIWHVPRPLPDAAALRRAVEAIRGARRPIIVAGGGVIYSEASAALRELVEATGIPVGETQAGKGSLPYDHPSALGAIGVTGTPGANILAREADLVIGIGTRYSDFTTASKTAFQHPDVQFVNINIADFDAHKLGAVSLVGDARETLRALREALAEWEVPAAYRERARDYQRDWDAEVERIYNLGHGPVPSQGEVIGVVNRIAGPRDVVVCAAGSLPGDLHKLWRTRDPKGYHVEYGYSCMGYEVAGGLGVRMAAPDREVYVMVGDGSWLMMSTELVTAIQEGIKITVVLIDNQGYGSIGGLSRSLGSGGFGTAARRRAADGTLSGGPLPVDLALNAESMGARVYRVETLAEFEAALVDARGLEESVVISIGIGVEPRVGGYESWWSVPVPEVSEMAEVSAARREYEEARRKKRWLI